MNLPALLRTLAAITCAGFLSSCASGSLGKSDSVTPPAGEGLVIIGYSFTSEPMKAFLSGSRCQISMQFGYHDNLVIDITRLEPTPSGAMEYISVLDGRCSQLTPEDPIGYNFLHLKPGLYAMTGLVTNGRISLAGDAIKYRLRFSNWPQFRVNAGDVIYLGDLITNSEKTTNSLGIHLPDNVDYRRSDDAAKAELARRNGPLDKFRYQPMTVRPARPTYQ